MNFFSQEMIPIYKARIRTPISAILLTYLGKKKTQFAKFSHQIFLDNSQPKPKFEVDNFKQFLALVEVGKRKWQGKSCGCLVRNYMSLINML